MFPTRNCSKGQIPKIKTNKNMVWNANKSKLFLQIQQVKRNQIVNLKFQAIQLLAHYHLWIVERWDSDLMVHHENLFKFFSTI
jgi:hypothetical protein